MGDTLEKLRVEDDGLVCGGSAIKQQISRGLKPARDDKRKGEPLSARPKPRPDTKQNREERRQVENS